MVRIEIIPVQYKESSLKHLIREKFPKDEFSKSNQKNT